MEETGARGTVSRLKYSSPHPSSTNLAKHRELFRPFVRIEAPFTR